jgi:putative ABC transport system permease protein
MNLLQLSLHRLTVRPLQSFLNLLLLALGAGLITFLLLITHQLQQQLSRNAEGIDLVVGAKGSPLQLILSGIFHIDVPTGNIPLQEFIALKNNRNVRKAIPLSLGDNYQRYRIVGTDSTYPGHYEASLGAGQWWLQEMEVVVGSAVTQKTGLRLGDTFAGAHGLDEEGEPHADIQYRVVGIMAPNHSVLDNLILTSIESVWHTHGIPHEHTAAAPADGHGHADGHDDHGQSEGGHSHNRTAQLAGTTEARPLEITMALIQYRGPMAAMSLPAYINRQTGLQAASPAIELARLLSLIGVGVTALRYFGGLILLIAGLSVFVALYNALRERQYDLAIMRTLGATRLQIASLIVLEGVSLAAIGTLAGMLLAHVAVASLGGLIAQSEQMNISGWVWLEEELWVFGLACGIGFVAALLPAVNAYRTDISQVLSKA